MTVSLRVEGIEDINQWLAELITRLSPSLRRGVDTVGKYVVGAAQTRTKQEGAVDTETYLNGWKLELELSGAPAEVYGVVFNEAGHEEFVEHGRPPGKFPPQQQIEDWMRRKGIPPEASFLIRRAIARNGTVARKEYEGFEIMDNTFEEHGDRILDLLTMALMHGFSEAGGGDV